MPRRSCPILVLFVLAIPLAAQPPSADEAKTWKVGVRPVAPFAMQDDERWTGLCIELWKELALERGITFDFVEVPALDDLLDGVREGRLDIAAAPLTVTAEREETLDFVHPFFTTGLGIAVPQSAGSGVKSIVRGLLSWEFVEIVLWMVGVLAFVALLIWIFERRRNPDFQGERGGGFGNAFWWSAVTMTTVGYGDKVPRTFTGRVVGFLWMFSAIILISTFTAAITASVTVSQLESRINGPDDLKGARVGVLPGSTSEAWAAGQGVATSTFATIPMAMEALRAGKVDAVVHDQPILLYAARMLPEGGVEVLPVTFERQDYAFVLPQGSPHREAFTRSIVELIRGENWRAVVRQHLGR